MLCVCWDEDLKLTQQAQIICITFVQRRPNVFDVGPTLYKMLYICFMFTGNLRLAFCHRDFPDALPWQQLTIPPPLSPVAHRLWRPCFLARHFFDGPQEVLLGGGRGGGGRAVNNLHWPQPWRFDSYSHRSYNTPADKKNPADLHNLAQYWPNIKSAFQHHPFSQDYLR